MIRDGVRRAFRLALRRRDGWARDVEDEIKLHLQLRAEQLAAQGASPDDAYREAVRRFGPLDESRARLLEAAAHREHRMARTEWLGDLRQDISFAARTLGREKAWTAITLLTLALGVGATTAVFSVVSALLLSPLPYPHSDRIVYVNQSPSERNNTGIQVTIVPGAAVVRAWKAQSHSFEDLQGFGIGPTTIKTSGDPSTIMAANVFPSFMRFAGQHPLLGRMFTDVDVTNGGHVVVLGESFWRQRFGGRNDVLGRLITLGDSSYMIVGVAPAAFRIGSGALSPTDVWLPLDIHNDKLGMAVMGRLTPGASVATAQRELDSIYARHAGFTAGKLPFRTVISTPAQRVSFRDSLIVLTWAVALVLLVACANVAHLLLARAGARQRELAIRAALGAGRARLLRQLLTESFVLAVAGTAAGVFVGWAGLHALVALRPQSLDQLKQASLDGRTLLVALGVALVSGLVFGVMGLVQASRYSTHDALKSGALAASRGRADSRTRSLLVITEMALSAMLLVGATLLVRSVVRMQHTNLGFQADGLYMMTMPLSPSIAPTGEVAVRVTAATMERVRTLPAVQSATLAEVGPGSREFSIGRLEVQGKPAPPATQTSFIDVNRIEPNYFATMHTRLTEGTTFTDSSAQSEQVIVNAGFARAQWGDASAIGHRIRIAQNDSTPWLTIVGVAENMSTGGPASESTAPSLFTPWATVAYQAEPTHLTDKRGPAPPRPSPVGMASILIRTNGSAQGLEPIAGFLRQIGIKRSANVTSVAQTISGAIAGPRFVMLLLAIFTGLALVLAGVGLYGVMSYSVAQRTREIGIRKALGAADSRIGRAIVLRGTALALVGAALGLAAASWGTKLIAAQLYGVTRSDPTSFVIGAAVLVAAAIIACVVPTRRALAVDPMTAIRTE